MKALSAVAMLLISALVSVEASQTCMYCKRMDTMSGFLYSYSYCPAVDDEKCLADSWNYINSQCGEPLVEGWQLDIE